jgi:hypothetical protein
MPNVFKLAKQIKKKHPRKHTKWSGYVKEAGQKIKKGNSPRKRTSRKSAKKRVARKKRTARVRRKPQMRVTDRTMVVVSGYRKPAKRRSRKRVHRARVAGTRRARVSGMKTSTMLLIGGGLLAAYLLLKPKPVAAATPAAATALGLVQTGNPVRDQSANTILAYAQAANLTAQAINSIIQHLNSTTDQDVTSQGQMTYDQWLAWYNGD